jgi:acetolactate synthase-1/2/3 large subunit
VVLCTDESVAVAAAHGYAMATGKPQVVMVFQDVGLLQGGGAIVNLKYGRIPVILCSGANSTPDRRDWRGAAQERRVPVEQENGRAHRGKFGPDTASAQPIDR